MADDDFNRYCEQLLVQFKRRNTKAVTRHLKSVCDILRHVDDHVVQTKFGGSVQKGTYVTGRFGMGPNWKLRVVRAALQGIGIDGNAILQHGIEREVYAIPLAGNWQEVLLGRHKNVRSLTTPAAEIADFCVNRWIVPRASRDNRYKSFDRCSILRSLLDGGPGPSW